MHSFKTKEQELKKFVQPARDPLHLLNVIDIFSHRSKAIITIPMLS